MRYREASLEADSGALKLRGTAIAYGVATGPPKLAYRELVRAGAFGNVADLDIVMNVQHVRSRAIARTGGGGLILYDSPTELKYEAVLPPTREAEDVVRLVRDRVLRGASIEFAVPANGERVINGTVNVEKARLSGLAVVDDGAYSEATVEARAELRAEGQGITGAFFYNIPHIISDRAAVDDGLRIRQARKSMVSSGAFDFGIQDGTREISLLAGRSYDRPLASRLAGTLELDDTPEALRFSVATLPNTTYVSDLRSEIASGAGTFGVQPIYTIPPESAVAAAVIEVEETGNPGIFIEIVREAILTAIAIVTRAPRGNPGMVALRQDRRRLLWL